MRQIGSEIVRLEEVVSTNTLALRDPVYLERHGLVLLARHQTGGRGRMGRQWASLPGRQLQFSVVLHPAFPAADSSGARAEHRNRSSLPERVPERPAAVVAGANRPPWRGRRERRQCRECRCH